MKFFRKYMLMNEAGGFGDAGGGGAGDGGAAGDNGAPAGSGDGAGGQAGDYQGPEWAKGWEGIEADILNDPSLKAIKDTSSLVKSYVHGQRQLGKKGVIIPTENSPKEEWDQFYQKVGVPLEEAKYKEGLKFPEKNLGDAFNDEFIKLSHEARLQPSQAAKLYEFFNTKSYDGIKQQQEAFAAQTQKDLNDLREKLGGEAYDVGLTKATAFLKENAGEDFIKYLGESGLGKNAKIVEAFMSMAKKFSSEGDLPRGDSGYGMSKDDLNREINNAFGNPKDPYHNPSHPDHKRRVDEIQGYFAKLEK